MKNKFIPIILSTSILALLLFLINWFLFKEIKNLFFAISLLSVLIFTFPIVVIKYTQYKRKKEIEDLFPVFLRDFVEVVRSGLAVPQAFKSVSNNDYKSLTPHVKKISKQLEWGISVEKTLTKFSQAVKSDLIDRIVSSVIETHRFGGNLADTFESLADTSVEIKRLRTERKAYLQSQLTTGYIIFFVFLAVIVALEKFLVPSLAQAPLAATAGLEPQKVMEEYKTIFMGLILIQGFFAGLTVGKMAEGEMVAGLKHSLFMMFVGGMVFVLIG
jgi:flagellar protein FlaJ